MNTATSRIADRRRNSSRWLRDLLRADILRDSFADGALPNESELMLSYRATRGTVREALDLLRNEGVIERIQGTGTLVIAYRFEGRLVEIHGVTEVNPNAFASHVLACQELPMPGVVAMHLDEPVGTPCLMLEYIGIAHGGVVGMYTNYVRFPEAERVAATPFNSHWYALLSDAGLEIAETDLLIEALVADDAVAERLGIAPGHPLLAMQQVIRDDAGRPYDFAILRHRADRLAIRSEARRPLVKEIGR
jgi:GntR family transcriptional regulator